MILMHAVKNILTSILLRQTKIYKTLTLHKTMFKDYFLISSSNKKTITRLAKFAHFILNQF